MFFNLLLNECDYENCKDYISICILLVKFKYENIYISMYDKCFCICNWYVIYIINE